MRSLFKLRISCAAFCAFLLFSPIEFVLAQNSDPFGSSLQGPTSNPSVDSRLTQKPDATSDHDLADIQNGLVVDLGRIVSGSDYLVELNITSKSKQDLRFHSLKPSDSSLEAISKGLNLKPGTAAPFRFSLKSPRKQGPFENRFVLEDPASRSRFIVTIQGSTQELVTLEKSEFNVGKAGHYTFETKATLNFPEIDFRKLLFRVNSSEFAGWRFVPTSESKATAYFDLVISAEDFEQSASLEIRDVPYKFLGNVPLRVIKSGKPKSLPSEIVLRRRKDGSIRGSATIQMPGLPELVRENYSVTLKGKILDPSDSSESNIELDAILRPISPTGVFAEVTLPQEIAANSDRKMSVQFEAGGESLWVPMRLQKD